MYSNQMCLIPNVSSMWARLDLTWPLGQVLAVQEMVTANVTGVFTVFVKVVSSSIQNSVTPRTSEKKMNS